MARPVVAMPAALEGLVPAAELEAGRHGSGRTGAQGSDTAHRMMLKERLGRLGRARVLRHYDWEGTWGGCCRY